jgi:hypothetical protein
MEVKYKKYAKKYFINTFGVSERYCSTAWKTRDQKTRIPERQFQNKEITMAITKKLVMIKKMI